MNKEIIYSSWFVEYEDFIDELKKGKYKLINENGIMKILDYITNLENQLKEIRKQNLYERKYGSDMEDKYLVEKSRIDKAVEYIEKHRKVYILGVNQETDEFDYISTSPQVLLNILRGENK